MGNTWSQIREALMDAGWGTLGTARYPQSRIMVWLQQGENRALRRLQIPGLRRVTLDVAANARYMSAGAPQGVDLLGQLTHRVIFTDSAGDQHVLVGITERMLDETRPGWRDDSAGSSGPPQFYLFDPVGNRIGLEPFLNYAQTSSLQVEFVRRAMRQLRIYDSGTVSVTFGDSAVTGFSTNWLNAKDLAAGMAFGIREPVDSINDQDPEPVRWYTAAEFQSAGAMNLTEAWAQSDRTSADYILASKSAFCDEYEDFQMIPVYWAMAHMALAEGDNESYQQHLAMFNLSLDEAEIDLTTNPDIPQEMRFAGQEVQRPEDYWESQQGRSLQS